MVIVLSGYNAFFDASYQKTTDGGQTIVAGYVSSVEQWAQWEINWRLVLAAFDVPYFKMSEFLGCREAFKHHKWRSNSYRARFVSQLIDVTKEWTEASFGALLKHPRFNFHNVFYELDTRYNPFVFCGRDCAIRVMKFVREEYKSDSPIAYIFDQGDEGRGMLMTEMEAASLPSPIFKRSRPDLKNPRMDIDDPPAIQLQACDLVAYEIGRGDIDFKLGKQLRKSLRAIGNIKNRRWTDIKDEDINLRMRNAGIQLRPAARCLENPALFTKARSFVFKQKP